MSALESTRHALCIVGRVTDQLTGAALGGAEISITAGPAAFQARQSVRASVGARDLGRTVTAADGSYGFRDLPDGQYTLAAAAQAGAGRYARATAAPSVARDAAGAVILAAGDMALAPTAIAGTVSAQGSGKPVPMATVALSGGGEATVTDTAGAYRLVAIEPGARLLVVSATGFATQTQAVTASAGATAAAATIMLAAAA